MFVDEKVTPRLHPTLAGFEDWLARQPPRKYDYNDMHRCALAQYYMSIGREPVRFASELFATYDDQCRYIHTVVVVHGHRHTTVKEAMPSRYAPPRVGRTSP